MSHKKCLKAEEDIAFWKRQAEELGARQLDEEEQKALDWLHNNIKAIPIQELTDNNLSIKQLLRLKPSEFQEAKTLVSHVTVFQYAMTKRETGKEGKALYKIFFVNEGEGEDPTSAEMKGFVRAVRAGELWPNQDQRKTPGLFKQRFDPCTEKKENNKRKVKYTLHNCIFTYTVTIYTTNHEIY